MRKLLLAMMLLIATQTSATTLAATKVSFPFTPISAASLPWWITKGIKHEADTHPDLTGINVSGLDLGYADLSFTQLAHGDLSGANLRDANLNHAELQFANLSRAYMAREPPIPAVIGTHSVSDVTG